MFYEHYAIISNFSNYAISTCGNVLNITTGRILKPGINTGGYYYVNLYKNKKVKNKRIHKLVSNAFLDNPENKKCCDHIDRDRKNNNITNLRYATSSENKKNSSIYKNNTSSCPGVSFKKKCNKWRVEIYINKKKKHIGCFDNFNDAETSRKYQEELHYKEYQPLQ